MGTPPPPLTRRSRAQTAALRQETERLALRGRIFDITEADSLPGLRLSPLGEVWITRDNPRDASGALARKAATMFPEARVLAGLSKTRKGDRIEWRNRRARMAAPAPFWWMGPTSPCER